MNCRSCKHLLREEIPSWNGPTHTYGHLWWKKEGTSSHMGFEQFVCTRAPRWELVSDPDKHYCGYWFGELARK